MLPIRIKLGCFALLLALTLPVAAQENPNPDSQQHAEKAKRLVLKDGSYQVATKWEVKGDHLRYLRAVRYEWEELPASLIDWTATDTYNKNPGSKRPAIGSADLAKIDAAEKRYRDREAARVPTVAPGIQLPSSGGVFLLDQYRGSPEL